MSKKRIALLVGIAAAYVSARVFMRRAYANGLQSAYMAAFAAMAEGSQERKCLPGDLQVVWLGREENAIEDMSHTGIAHCTRCGLQEVVDQMSDDCRLDDFIDAHYQM